LYRKLAEGEKDILSVHISSGLSGTVNSARDGSEQVKGEATVHCWDTLTLSGGERFQVMAAALAAKTGWTINAIQERLARIRETSEFIFTLDTLEYLARGGRIGRVKAIAGALLNLKPIIRVDTDGKYTTVKTERTINKSITTIGNHLQEKYGNTPVWVAVMNGRFADKADMLAKEVREKLNIVRFETVRVSPVLGVHTGPGVIGVAVVPMELMSDLVG
jgi:DegV family protein with EDD domain